MMDAPAVAAPERYFWSLELPRPTNGCGKFSLQTMTASEQMFFAGAPLAHVVCFEEHGREQRDGVAMRRFLRGRRGLPN